MRKSFPHAPGDKMRRADADNAERLRFYDFVKYRHDVTAKLDYSLAFARNVGCL